MAGMMFKLGRGSMRELCNVHPGLVNVVERAITLTPIDFGVHDGIRTIAEQRALVNAGASRTMNSKHLIQEDGWGHAVDLVPYINGKLRWEWAPIYKIAEAVRAAALKEQIRLRWGGCWCELTATEQPAEQLVQAYVAKRKAAGRSAFIDGPHYELLGTT
jgi:peptidoglycan L-alanyl-D-glutamate endopeptidase CwlK